MKNQFFIFLLFFVITGCVQNEPTVTLINDSREKYDSVQVFSSVALPTTFTKFKPGDKRSGRIHFDAKKKNDGAYGLKLYKGNEVIRSRYFGYYTNGASLNSNFTIRVESDTILIDEQ
jgi:hypothetical protein